MDTREVENLAIWIEQKVELIESQYNQIIHILQSNANSQHQQPISSLLDDLLATLRSFNLETLSLQQIELLKKLDVDDLIGHAGADYLENQIKLSTYDPASSYNAAQNAFSRLQSVRDSFRQFRTGLSAIRMSNEFHDELPEPHDHVIIRVGFKSEASIENVTQWRDSSKDWYEIIRGISLAVNQAPEDTKVVGVDNGSIILTLAGTASVTYLLSLISRHVMKSVKDAIDIANSMEDLKQKKILTKTMEDEFKLISKNRKSDTISEIIADIRTQIQDLNGEHETALTNSIKKLISFNEKGGNVDFVAPEESGVDDIDDLDADQEGSDAPLLVDQISISEVRRSIYEMQAVREQLKLLTSQNDN